MAEPDYPELPLPLGITDDEPPVSASYTKREVLGSIVQTQLNSGKPTIVEIIRYTWNDEVTEQAGHRTCIRLRKNFIKPDGSHFGSEAMGVPEADWYALVEACKKVKL